MEILSSNHPLHLYNQHRHTRSTDPIYQEATISFIWYKSFVLKHQSYKWTIHSDLLQYFQTIYSLLHFNTSAPVICVSTYLKGYYLPLKSTLLEVYIPHIYVSAYVSSSYQCSPDSYSCPLAELAKLSRPAAITAVGPSRGDLPIRGVGGACSILVFTQQLLLSAAATSPQFLQLSIKSWQLISVQNWSSCSDKFNVLPHLLSTVEGECSNSTHTWFINRHTVSASTSHNSNNYKIEDSKLDQSNPIIYL